LEGGGYALLFYAIGIILFFTTFTGNPAELKSAALRMGNNMPNTYKSSTPLVRTPSKVFSGWFDFGDVHYPPIASKGSSR
jgi:hypothetical protein